MAGVISCYVDWAGNWTEQTFNIRTHINSCIPAVTHVVWEVNVPYNVLSTLPMFLYRGSVNKINLVRALCLEAPI
jgi:hypothetical protein